MGLVVAADVSEDGGKVVAVVAVLEHVLKGRDFGRACSGLKHFRRVGSDRKKWYLKTFARRYLSNIKGF